MYRRHLIDTAEQLFSEQGFESTRMQDVAAKAAVSLTTLYGIFPRKPDLYEAIAEARGEELMARVDGAVAGLMTSEGTTPLAAMLHGMDTHVRFFMEHPAYLKMILLQGHVWYHRASRPSRAQQDQWSRGEQLVEAAFAVGAESGLFVVEDPGSQARTMVALQQTHLANWVLRGMVEAPEVVITRVQAEFVRAFCLPSVTRRVLTDDGLRVKPAALTISFLPAKRRTSQSRERR